MSLEFPFEYAYIEGLGKLFYPIVKAKLKTINGWREFEFLIDTGADITTVPSHLLPVLGIELSKLAQNKTLGVGGFTVKTWDFQTYLQLGDREIQIQCSAVVSRHDSMPLLLGRKDIFEAKFNLFLDSRRKVTVISGNNSER